MPNAFSASDTAAPSLISGVHHIGVSVSDFETALAFWERFLGKPARWKTVLDRPYLGEIVGYPGIHIRAAFLDLPGGTILELLDYQDVAKSPNPEATANPGNIHICLAVTDADAAWKHAVACGARPVRAEGPVAIDGGPNKGAKGAYLRVHDGVTVEIFQRPPEGAK